MLTSLRISRIGVIDEALLEFGPGFTALTGETGAGKTMVITGLGLLLGNRLDRGRTGHTAMVAGTFTVDDHEPLRDAIDELGADADDGEVLVVRRVTKDGRSRAHLGGVPVPIGTLAGKVAAAVTVHGQSDQQRLRTADAQREALDAFDPERIGPAADAYRDVWQRARQLRTELAELDALITQRDREAAEIREALERIEGVDPQPGEDQQLREQIHRLSNLADFSTAMEAASSALGGDDGPSALMLLDMAIEQLHSAARIDAGVHTLAETLISAREATADALADLSRRLTSSDTDPMDVDAAHQRLHELTSMITAVAPVLTRVVNADEESSDDGLGADVDAMLAASGKAAARLDRFDTAGERRSQVAADLETATADLDAAAAALSKARSAAAERFADAIHAELIQLQMPQATVQVSVQPGPQREHGANTVAITLAAHPGATPEPVADAASGGELSRVMLAVEVALAGQNRNDHTTPVFIFDEIDAGIGGKAALAVGQRLARLAQHAQVIAVTHLPQVAAHASTHLQIVKHTDAERTTSTVETLSDDARVRELARMMAGDDGTEVALAHAEQLLQDAHTMPARNHQAAPSDEPAKSDRPAKSATAQKKANRSTRTTSAKKTGTAKSSQPVGDADGS